jgi:hypothetical protein
VVSISTPTLDLMLTFSALEDGPMPKYVYLTIFLTKFDNSSYFKKSFSVFLNIWKYSGSRFM